MTMNQTNPSRIHLCLPPDRADAGDLLANVEMAGVAATVAVVVAATAAGAAAAVVTAETAAGAAAASAIAIDATAAVAAAAVHPQESKKVCSGS